jgi:hypothetical protein
MASSSAMTTRVVTRDVLSCGGSLGLGQQPVEQLVLRELELGDLLDDLGSMPGHGLGVALGVVVLPVGERGLRHERAEPGVVGRIGEVAQLLLGDGQLLTEVAEPSTHLRQAALHEGPGHGRQCTPVGATAPICDDARVPPPLSRFARSAVGLGVALLGVGCAGSGTGACGPVQREALDPAYLVHVLGDATDVEYGSDPPTSGPHQPAPSQQGALDEPLARPVQVGILERGDVLIQHRPDLPAEERAALVDLAGDRVVVAPNPDLTEPIVATAWVFKQSCQALDLDALAAFIDQRAGQGPKG